MRRFVPLLLSLVGCDPCVNQEESLIPVFLYVSDESECREGPLLEAIDWWSKFNEDSLVYVGCVISDHERNFELDGIPDHEAWERVSYLGRGDALAIYALDSFGKPNIGFWLQDLCSGVMGMRMSPGISDETLKLTFMHEIGHFHGLGHNFEDEGNVMNYPGGEGLTVEQLININPYGYMPCECE